MIAIVYLQVICANILYMHIYTTVQKGREQATKLQEMYNDLITAFYLISKSVDCLS